MRSARVLATLSVSLCLLSVLSACGGGTGESGAISEESVIASANASPSSNTDSAGTAGMSHALAVTSTSSDTTWTQCANEGGQCNFSGTRQVRYGTAALNVVDVYTASVSCTNSVFGDPAVGAAKACWYSSQTVDASLADPWVPCANEGQQCAFSGARSVRYGTATQFNTLTATNGVACTNAVFSDPAPGQSKTCRYLGTGVASAATTAAVAAPISPAATGSNPPIVFNASATAHAGDVVNLQGVNFGNAPSVYLESAASTALEIVNRVGTGWLAVQIPSSATGAFNLRIDNGSGVSARVQLNAARPQHLDTMQIVPGGAFRVFGRNLYRSGSTPLVSVNGSTATVDLTKSDEYTLSVVAPTSLQPTSAATVTVDNGNGSGASTLDRRIAVVSSSGTDPFSLGVGWASGFGAIAGNKINATTDSRLGQKVACNGSTDDIGAIQAAIDLAASGGGGIVQLPAGHCVISGSINLRSRVAVQGAGKASTQVVYQGNYPVWAVGLDLTGIGNLTLANAGNATEGPLLKNSTRVFIQNVSVQLQSSNQMYLSDNSQFVVSGSDFVQVSNANGQGPYTLNNSAGLVFEGNTTQWSSGAPAFGRVHDSYVHANHFTRNAASQTGGGTVHSLTVDFAYRLAVVGNTFDVANGPVTNTTRNDGETILTEGGGASRTENLGTVTAASATSVTDSRNTFQLDPFATGSIPENYGVAIVGGTGAGQTREVVSASGSTLNVDHAWDIVPDQTSHYGTFVWGLEKSFIKDNNLSQNPRGIWLYHTAIREVDVVNNSISEGGGIYLRTYQNLATKSFMPIYNVVIANNRISNTTGHWMSYINSVFVNGDAQDFGIATIGIEMRANQLTANQPNVYSSSEEYAGMEGFMNMMRLESASAYVSSAVPHLLGTIFTSNSCTNCDVAIRLGTGAGGTTILNTQLVNSSALTTDWATANTAEKSTATVIR